MLKWKYKKILACFMAGSLLMQTFSGPVMAGEASDSEVVSAMSQAESDDFSQENTVSDTSGQSDTEEGNTGSDDPNQGNTDAADTDPADVEITAPDQNDTDPADVEITAPDQNDTDPADIEIIDPDQDDSTSDEIDIKNTEDLINLSNQNAADYQNKTITITRNTAENLDLTIITAEGKTFQGLGSEANPFMGTLKITNSDTSTIDILINHSFFNYLDQSAKIDSGLYLKTRGQNQMPLLAEHFVNKNTLAGSEDGGNISLTIEAAAENDDQDKKAGFGGIIGTMDANTKLALTVKNNTKPDVNLTVSGTGNVGFFCNTMETGAALTISSYTDETSGSNELKYPVASTNGNAGGLVGEMKADTSLTVAGGLKLTGDVTAGVAAGGLLGAAEDAAITFSQPVTRSGKIQGASESGGYIGKFTCTKAMEINLEKLTVQDLTLGDCKHAGGFFGVLNVGSSEGTLNISTATVNSVSQTGSCWQFGGIIGQYSASSQNSILHLESPNVNITGNGSVTAAGGIIGSVAKEGADDVIQNAASAYIEISNATVSTQLTNDLIGEGCCFGGLVAELGTQEGQGHFVSVSGTTTIKGSDNGKAPSTGGILGKASNGILRLSGTTDLSGFTIGKTGTECGQIAGTIDGTIVYARGTGNGNGGDGYDWKFIRPASASVSDVGSYGEVIRLDGSSLKESDGSSDANTLFNYYANSHQLTVAYIPGDNPMISSKRDLAALAILIQKNKTSGLLNQNITVSSSLSGQTLDLSGTGIVSLLRDNGSQIYTGTFEGSSCIVKMAAGEAYGYMSDSTLAVNADGNSAAVGIGQIYNHSAIGFLPYCNGTVQNLTLDGFVYFQNVSGGTDVRCGAAAGYTDGAVFRNVTAKTQIVYRDGLGGADLKVMSIGGLTGRAKGTVTFENCSMQGSISSVSGCHDFAIGGYLAAGDEGTNVTFRNCSIKSTAITHEKFADSSSAPDAMFGGLAGCMTGSVTIEGLTVDGLSMKSYAAQTSGGLLGYYWRKNDDAAYASVKITGLAVKNSSLDVQGKFGGLVYSTDAYWQIGDGTGTESTDGAPNGIRFIKDGDKANTFTGKTNENAPSALLICSTTKDANTTSAKAYIEIRKNGLDIQENAVNVTLTDGDYFDDIAGKTKYGEDGYNAVLSIGLTALNAAEPELIDQKKSNTWTNQCTVNGKQDYTNKNTRYYYNVDYYRKVEGTGVTDIDTPGKLLLRSLYVYARDNLKQYFVKGSDDFKLTGKIDLRGVSYYPMSRVITIENAAVIFDYQNMNDTIQAADKRFDEIASQHYQMQTGLFSKVTQKFTVKNLTLQGTFGRYEIYEKTGKNKTGVLICDTIGLENTKADQAGITITGLNLDGIRCSDGVNLPLLINAVDSNTAISMNNVDFTREQYDTSAQPVASALMGQVGNEKAEKISLEFANMDLNRKDENSFFSTAIFAESFRYADGASGGAYNFEKDAEKKTFGKEISNGVNIAHNRNSYNETEMTGQVWYVDTFGNTENGSYVGAGGPADSPQDFSGYLPYIGYPENAQEHYYEIDVNQRAVYLADGCGTYGHPWVIQDVYRSESSENTLFTGEDQMLMVMKLLDGTASNGIALKISPTVLDAKINGQVADIGKLNLHTSDTSDDIVLVKNGDTWSQAEKVGNRYKAITNGKSYSNKKIIAYLRNAYFLIKDDLTLDVGQFNGWGREDVSYAFSGVIIGDKTKTPAITLTGIAKKTYVGGLIRYSQGSVVKNLNIKLENVTFTGSWESDFFGGVIGRVIGGDNIIDGVELTAESVKGSGDTIKYTAVGGYVGLVGGYNDTKGGGVVFRNIKTSSGLTSISGKVTNTENENGSYYWNPYVGRVLDGYACAEESCTVNMYNTDKNYTIPKLDSSKKLKIEGNTAKTLTKSGVRQNSVTLYPNSTIILDSAQSIWLLSAIVNSGFGAKDGSTYYNDNSVVVEASYYGRTRTGSYDGVGTDSCSGGDEIDEKDYWGGKLQEETVNKVSVDKVDHRQHSTSYLSTYVDAVKSAADSTSIDAKAVTGSLTSDPDGRSIVFVGSQEQTASEVIYDLKVYGNGFRGIGHNYGLPSGPLKAKALRLKDQDGTNAPKAAAVNGNGAVIEYKRTINEYGTTGSITNISLSQAGFFTQCLANSSVTYTVENLNFQNVTLKRNCGKDYVTLGVVYARDGAYAALDLIFKNVTVKDAALDQADWAGALLGYMSNARTNNNETITFVNCTVENFTAGNSDTTNGDRMNHCGALIGKVEASKAGKVRKVTFTDCTAKNVTMYKVQNGGLFGGHIAVSCAITGGSAENGEITSRSNLTGGGYSMGGLVGKTEELLTVSASKSDTTDGSVSPVNIKNIRINGSLDVNTDQDSYAGGLAGYAASADISDVTVDAAKIAGKNLGGVIGGVVGSASMQNVTVKDSLLANCIDQKGNNKLNVGGLAGIVTGSLKGFNILSQNNIIGYLIKDGKVQSGGFRSSDFDTLSETNIGLQLNDNTYVTYAELADDASVESNSPCGIWAGNANSNDVKLVAVSRQGAYSAVKNIGTGKNTDSYVIYADYTGTAEDSSKISTSPDAVIAAGSTALTGDGAAMSVRDTIIKDTVTTPSLMKGHYGADQNRSLDEVVKQFGTDGVYQSRLSKYKKEDTAYEGEDFPVLILNAATTAELNSIVDGYISMLTNDAETQKKHDYSSITLTTYKYADSVWTAVSKDEQTMDWTKASGIKINRGKYDNNKNQITVLDVSYLSPVNENEVCHLYIPILVKKLMDVDCSVQIVNGAAGYLPDNIGDEATLNSFGENYTAQISYTYKWTVSEWQSMLENEDSLLWNFDKTVQAGAFGMLDRDKIHLTLVDMNTHGTQPSYYQSTLKELETAGKAAKDTLSLKAMAENGHAPYLCDLLPLEAAEDTDGKFKVVNSNDMSAVLRIWDKNTNEFIYYAPRTADDSDKTYYAVTLTPPENCGSGDILPVTEQYYLIINSTEGNETTPMINTKVELNSTYTDGQIPTRVTGILSRNYILGDFYKISNLSLESKSKGNSTEMKSGSNDTINVKVFSQVNATVSGKEDFAKYVNERFIYYQYVIQMVDQDGNPVDMKGAVSIPSLKLEKKDVNGNVTETQILNSLEDLNGNVSGFTAQYGENGCYITIKAKGSQYTGAKITAELNFSYTLEDLSNQFPAQQNISDGKWKGVQFKASAVMAYQQDSLSSSCITAATEAENKLYYRMDESQAKLSYDSYNISSKDGNTSQLGINGRENNDQPMKIGSRALFDASAVSGLNLTNAADAQYPYYLEGELTLAVKTETEVTDSTVIGKEYQQVSIGSYLSDFEVKSGNAEADTTSSGLGIQNDGKTFKFRIQLTQAQVSEIMNTPILVEITYKVKTGQDLVDIDGKYANYKVTLSATLKNQNTQSLLTAASDYLVYTNAKVYRGIVGANQNQ